MKSVAHQGNLTGRPVTMLTQRQTSPRSPTGLTSPETVTGAVANRSNGMASLAKILPGYLARLRADGIAEADILRMLLENTAEVARATGNDRMDLITSEPRWAYVAERITRIVESTRVP